MDTFPIHTPEECFANAKQTSVCTNKFEEFANDSLLCEAKHYEIVCISNECIYSILLFLNPKHLQLCTQINNTFNQLCQLDSLWRNQIEDKYNVLFKKENCYENCKLYYQLNVFKRKFKVNKPIDKLYKLSKLKFLYQNPNPEPSEIEQLNLLGNFSMNVEVLIEWIDVAGL